MTAETQAKRIANLRAEEVRRDEAALRYLLADERGRWFISRMLERCHVFSTTANDDMNRMLLMEGERRVGVELYDNLRMLSVIDETGVCEEQRRTAEAEYGRFMVRYKIGKEQDNAKL